MAKVIAGMTMSLDGFVARVDVMPVILGGGLRLLEHVEPTRLEKIDVEEVGARTSFTFRVAGSERVAAGSASAS
ncbi:MAG TPA: hypothetical protein VNP93_13200 [Gaiellaceae bacterium]|nr:hypothetical protein [Gaiellaceae bacterium]